MYLVIATAHKNSTASFACFQCWGHTTPEKAVQHAEARSQFDGLTYEVVYGGKTIYQTNH